MSDQLPAAHGPWLHDLGRWIARVAVPPGRSGSGCTAAERVPLTGPVVLVANHSSMADGPILFGELPRRAVFLVKQEMFSGLPARSLRKIGQLTVRRGEADRTPLMAALKVLRAGGVVGVFPEGTRGAVTWLTRQQGAAWLVRSSGAVVLPVACRGTLRPPATRAGSARWTCWSASRSTFPTEKGRAALDAATEQIRDRLATLVAELDRLRDE